LVSYIHHDEQLSVNDSNDKSDNKSDGSAFSKDKMEKMQTKEPEKCKAWGSLQTPTKEAAVTSPLKKKENPETTVDLTHSPDPTGALETDDMEYKQHELDGSFDISDDDTKQPPIGTKFNTQNVTIIDGTNNETTHSSDTHNGDTDSNKSAAMDSPEGALTNKSPSGIPPLQDPPSILKRQKNKQSMLQAAASCTKAGVNPFLLQETLTKKASQQKTLRT
jgi:hypothetical protein